MAEILTNLGLVSTALFGIATDAVTFVLGQPLLLMFFLVALVGSGVSLFQRVRG